MYLKHSPKIKITSDIKTINEENVGEGVGGEEGFELVVERGGNGKDSVHEDAKVDGMTVAVGDDGATKQMKMVVINITLAVKVKRNSSGTQASRIHGAKKEDGRNGKQQNKHLGRAE